MNINLISYRLLAIKYPRIIKSKVSMKIGSIDKIGFEMDFQMSVALFFHAFVGIMCALNYTLYY